MELLWIMGLTAAVVCVHGYHPFAEDGGLYAAGLEYTLDPSLFPHETRFVTAHLRYSIFAPLLARAVRMSSLSVPVVLFGSYLLTAALMLFAVRALLRACLVPRAARIAGVALVAAVWTTPVAGTSLLLMDPYLTARSFAVPLGVLAVSFAIRAISLMEGRRWLRGGACVLLLLGSALFHPLMAGYAAGLSLAILCTAGERPWLRWGMLSLLGFTMCAGVQYTGAPERGAALAAVHSRYYWFLSQWKWYERVGIAGPLLVLWLLRRINIAPRGSGFKTVLGATTGYALLATSLTILFAQEHFSSHAVARLQPLRALLFVYTVLFATLGASLTYGRWKTSTRLPGWRRIAVQTAAWALICIAAILVFLADRATFPSSPQIELPGTVNQNAWVQAFLWCREHTRNNDLFALDAHYIEAPKEDAQTFRAWSYRDALPDFSKDGGQAAIEPSLATGWAAGVAATDRLSSQSDHARAEALRGQEVRWMLLEAKSVTQQSCPYRNAVVKVCKAP